MESMEIAPARRDSQEPNAMNANQIFLEPSVISVKQPSMIIHPARVCLRNSFVASEIHTIFYFRVSM